MTTASFSQRIIDWYHIHGRKTLPWQQRITPYRVYVSEIMLQQTQVNTVIPYYQAFMKRFPSVKSLALADQDAVMHQWSGLGYYSRARNLHKTARIIHSEYHGRFPANLEDLMALPGIGRSTAGAILSLSMQIHAPILDGNVKRVLARHHAIDGWPGKTDTLKQLWSVSESLTPKESTHHYNQAMMDMGATLCTRKAPLCSECPIEATCITKQTGEFDRYPGKKPRAKSRRQEQTHCLLLTCDHGVLLEKRDDSGIWGGLWCFPEINDTKDIEQHCQSAYGLSCHQKTILPTFKHVFSHYDLFIKPVIIKVNLKHEYNLDPTRYFWYKSDQDLPGGIAKPTAKLLQQHQEDIK